MVQKCLENDLLLFVEGIRDLENPDFLDEDEVIECDERLIDDNLSAGDNERELDEKIERIHLRDKPKIGIFESSPYFKRMFPGLKIQKPGYDLYGWTTFFSGVLAYYVFVYYGEFSVDQANYLKDGKQNISIFKGDMVVCLLIIITVIIIERYANRSDTKPIHTQGFSDEKVN